MKKIYLHIGAGKTGTSALQSQLAINKDVLSEHGIYYPTSSSEERAKKYKITSGNAVDLGLLLRDDESEVAQIKKVIKNHINNAKGKDILLSSETMEIFSSKNGKICKDFALDLGYEVKVIYYVRALADSLVSLYHQTIKRHNNTNEFTAFIKNKQKRLLETIERSGAVFGFENLILKNYDLAKDNIFVDFLVDVLGIQDTQEFTIKNKKVNRSLTKSEILLMKHMNKFFSRNIESTFVSDALIHNNPNIKYKMSISQKSMDSLASMYEDDIKKINSYLPENERPFKLVDDLEIVEDSKPSELNNFQQSVAAILAELVKEVKK